MWKSTSRSVVSMAVSRMPSPSATPMRTRQMRRLSSATGRHLRLGQVDEDVLLAEAVVGHLLGLAFEVDAEERAARAAVVGHKLEQVPVGRELLRREDGDLVLVGEADVPAAAHVPLERYVVVLPVERDSAAGVWLVLWRADGDHGFTRWLLRP